MMEIQVADQNDQLIEANLDGTTFLVHVSWNESGQYYTFGLENSEGEVLVEGVALVQGYPLLYRLRHAYLPLGEMLLICDKGAELTRSSFRDKTAKLYYLTQDDLEVFGILTKYGRI